MITALLFFPFRTIILKLHCKQHALWVWDEGAVPHCRFVCPSLAASLPIFFSFFFSTRLFLLFKLGWPPEGASKIWRFSPCHTSQHHARC